jgi:hypothetical protein
MLMFLQKYCASYPCGLKGGGGHKERVKEGKYGRNIMYYA